MNENETQTLPTCDISNIEFRKNDKAFGQDVVVLTATTSTGEIKELKITAWEILEHLNAQEVEVAA